MKIVKGKVYCPNCCSASIGGDTNGNSSIIYCRRTVNDENGETKWGCGWKGESNELISWEEATNIRRTELIDRMTKMIKMTLHI